MFANLKNKLIEEVKASPSKFQQFANAAQAAVSSSSTPNGSESTTSNEAFFSITEEDTPQNSPNKQINRLPLNNVRGRTSMTSQTSMNGSGGAIQRTRKLSNSSMASDVSFRLPSYDSPAVYNLQSDFEASGSEFEFDDSASTTKLDVITKEQLFDAYKKSLDRYHRYRCRYTDLAKRYKDLERDSTKARSVLVETQEKAIRRINELREQCTLEQQAKAHLEEALRMEMDDMQCKMQTYQTKLQLLGETPETIATTTNIPTPNDSLISLDTTNPSAVNGSLISLEENISREYIELEKQLQAREQQIKDLTERQLKYDKDIDDLHSLLAETKHALHLELEVKDGQIKQLSDSIKQTQGEQQQQQATNKINNELKDLREKLKQIQITKQELDAKVIANEHLMTQHKEQFAVKEKSLNAVEEKLKQLTKEYELKQADLHEANTQLNQMTKRHEENELLMAKIDDELKRNKNEKDTLQATIHDNSAKIQAHIAEYNKLKDLFDEKERNNAAERETYYAEHAEHLKLSQQLTTEKENREIAEEQIKKLQIDLKILNEQTANSESEIVTTLKAELDRTQTELNQQMIELKQQLQAKEKELKSLHNKTNKQKKQHETQQNKFTELTQELEALKTETKLGEDKWQQYKQEVLERERLSNNENIALKSQITQILDEITQMEEQMRLVRASHAELEHEKHNLEIRIEDMQKQSNDDGKEKLKHIESENAQLAEKNCLLEENAVRLEKLLNEFKRQQTSEEANISEMRLKLATAEDTIQKLNEKMSQVLDENSQMHNARELMDHDYRTLQDKYDVLEKEKLQAIDVQNCQQKELELNKTIAKSFEEKLQQLQIQNTTELNEKQIKIEELTKEMNDMEKLKVDIEILEKQTEELEHTKEALQLLREESVNSTKEYELLKQQLTELQIVEQSLRYELTSKNESNEKQLIEMETKMKLANADVERLHESNDAFQVQIDKLQTTHQSEIENIQKTFNTLQVEHEKLLTEAKSVAENVGKLQKLEVVENENQNLLEEIKQLRSTKTSVEENIQIKNHELEELKEKFKSLQCAVYVFEEKQANHAKELQQKQAEVDRLQDSNQELLQQLSEKLLEMDRQQEHDKFIMEQNDTIQTNLTNTTKQLDESTQKLNQTTNEFEEFKLNNVAKEQQIIKLNEELKQQNRFLEELNKQLDVVKSSNVDNERLQQEILALRVELEEKSTIKSTVTQSLNETTKTSTLQQDAEHLRQMNATLQKELEDLKHKSHTEISDLHEEIEDLQGNAQQMTERIMELERIRATYQMQQQMEATAKQRAHVIELNDNDIQPSSSQTLNNKNDDKIIQEKHELETKLKTIMNEVQDVSNRNLFLEQKCENYLILEQSNERLKSQNAKLSRQLDETLVSMQHSDNLSANTEFEYLKNIMFQYLTGSANGNNETLVKVISAVLKFSPQQTQVALEKEHQRRSLINKIL